MRMRAHHPSRCNGAGETFIPPALHAPATHLHSRHEQLHSRGCEEGVQEPLLAALEQVAALDRLQVQVAKHLAADGGGVDLRTGGRTARMDSAPQVDLAPDQQLRCASAFQANNLLGSPPGLHLSLTPSTFSSSTCSEWNVTSKCSCMALWSF